MMQGPNDDNDDLLSYMEICDFDLENPSNLEMDLNMPDFSAFFEDAPEFDSPLQNLNQIPIQNQIQSQNQNQNQFASFDALNPNPNPNPILNPNPNFNPNFHPLFRNENPQMGQNPTRLNLNQNLHIPPPIFHHNNNNPSLNINNTNNNLSLNNNNNYNNNNNNLNNIASSSRGEMDNSRQSRKRPDAMPPQLNRGSGITINGASSSSRYSGITNSGISNPEISNTGISNIGISNTVASESVQNNIGINGGGFVRNTRMRTDPVHNPNGSFSLNLPLYNTIPMPNPNPNNPINPNPNVPINPNLMMGIPNFRNPNSIPRIGTSFQAVPINVPASRVSNDDQIRRALINNINNNINNNNNNNQVRSQSQPITAGTSQARNNINNYNNLYYNNMNNNNNNLNNNNNGLSGFSIGSLNGSERPQFRRLLRPRTGTAGIQVPAVQNISRRREQTQVILDTYRQSVMDSRRRVARQMLGILRPGENISLEDIILFEQTISLRDSVPDRHRDMRLDVDNMSYEELLALEERIGNVSTGLNEDIIMKRLKQKLYVNNLSLSKEGTEPCCICQEEYEEGDKVGKLECGHDFHTACIKKWLVQKNLCPICKKPGLNA